MGGVVGIAIWQLFLVDLFEPPKDGKVNYTRVLFAGLVGAGGALVGSVVGAIITSKKS